MYHAAAKTLSLCVACLVLLNKSTFLKQKKHFLETKWQHQFQHHIGTILVQSWSGSVWWRNIQYTPILTIIIQYQYGTSRTGQHASIDEACLD